MARSSSPLYRFRPTRPGDLTEGVLEAAEIMTAAGPGLIAPGEVRALLWHEVPDPSAVSRETRIQVPEATTFAGGEGCWYGGGHIYFTTKLGNRVWCIEPLSSRIRIAYDIETSPTPILKGFDNVYVVTGRGCFSSQRNPGVTFELTGPFAPFEKVPGLSGPWAAVLGALLVGSNAWSNLVCRGATR